MAPRVVTLVSQKLERSYCDLTSEQFNPSNDEVTFIPSTKMQRFFENQSNPVMLVFIGKLSLSTLR